MSPAELFTPPDGGLIILLADGVGGAFKHYDDRTAELKRVWTRSAHRRRGFARLIVAELESEAERRGNTRIFLTTGPKQPEAAGLYRGTGYRGIDADEVDHGGVGLIAFEKDL